jgi:hypothetical protein
MPVLEMHTALAHRIDKQKMKAEIQRQTINKQKI